MLELVRDAFTAPTPAIPARAANARGRISGSVAAAAAALSREVELRVGSWDGGFRRGVSLAHFSQTLRLCNEYAASHTCNVQEWQLSVDSFLTDNPGVRVTTSENAATSSTLKVPAGDGVATVAEHRHDDAKRPAVRVALSFERPAVGHVSKLATVSRVRVKVRKSFTLERRRWRIDCTRVWERTGPDARTRIDIDLRDGAPPTTLELEAEYVGPEAWNDDDTWSELQDAISILQMPTDTNVIKSFQ